jgi:hypothetical protein
MVGSRTLLVSILYSVAQPAGGCAFGFKVDQSDLLDNRFWAMADLVNSTG